MGSDAYVWQDHVPEYIFLPTQLLIQLLLENRNYWSSMTTFSIGYGEIHG